jgi:putative flippase GtrA
MILQLMKKYRHILLYLFFGVTTTAVNWCIYALSHDLLGMTAANAVAWLGAVVYAFVTNKLFVFESKGMKMGVWLAEGVKFLASRVLSGVVEVLLPTGLFALGLNQSLFGLEGGIAKALVSVVVIVMNYVLSRFLVFSK